MKRLWLLSLVLLAWAVPGRAADLVDAVPGDAVIVVRVTALRDHWRQLVESPTWQKLEQAPIPDVRNGIAQARQQIADFERQSGLKVEENLAALFGTDMLLALFSDKTAVFLARTPDLEKLRQTVDTLHAIERNDGKLIRQGSERYAGVEIQSDILSDRRKGELAEKRRHYAQVGDLLIVSEELPVVARVIDVLNGKAPALPAAPAFAEAAGSMRPEALLRLYVDTRRLGELQDLETVLNGSLRNAVVKLLARRVRQVLPATRYFAADLVAASGRVEARYVLAYDEQKLPESLRALQAAKPDTALDIQRLVPPNAVAAYANRFNKAALWRYLVDSTREADPAAAERLTAQAALIGAAIGGMDFEKELLPQIGDQNALVVTPGAAGAPPGVTLLIEMKDPASIALALKTLAGTAAGINRNEREKKGLPPEILLARSRHRDVDLTTVELKDPKFGGQLNPTLCVCEKFLVISTAPEAARAILDAAAAPAEAGRAGAQLSAGRLDVVALRAILAQYRDFLVRQGVREGKPEMRARQDIDNAEFLFGLFRRVELSGRYVPGRIERSLRLTVDAPDRR